MWFVVHNSDTWDYLLFRTYQRFKPFSITWNNVCRNSLKLEKRLNRSEGGGQASDTEMYICIWWKRSLCCLNWITATVIIYEQLWWYWWWWWNIEKREAKKEALQPLCIDLIELAFTVFLLLWDSLIQRRRLVCKLRTMWSRQIFDISFSFAA